MPTNTLHPEPHFTLDDASFAVDEAAGPVGFTRKRGNRSTAAILAILALAGTYAATFFFWPRNIPVPQPVQSTTLAPFPASPVSSEPTIDHPLKFPGGMDTGHPQAPLPAVDSSDLLAHDAIKATLIDDSYMRLLASSGVIRHLVATIDSLPRKAVATRIWPVAPVPGIFATTSASDGTLIAGDNLARYTPYVNAAESIDSKRLAQYYFRLYPLFQQAYVELGYPGGYFNDRVIDVIDHLLAAPEPTQPILLHQPKVMVEFADPDFEELSAGQKILVRVGRDNELHLKAKLREIRVALTGRATNP